MCVGLKEGLPSYVDLLRVLDASSGPLRGFSWVEDRSRGNR